MAETEDLWCLVVLPQSLLSVSHCESDLPLVGLVFLRRASQGFVFCSGNFVEFRTIAVSSFILSCSIVRR